MTFEDKVAAFTHKFNAWQDQKDREFEELSKEHLALLLEAFPDRNPFTLEVGSWDCEASPFKFCVYDTSLEDPCERECCIVCDEPEERL